MPTGTTRNRDQLRKRVGRFLDAGAEVRAEILDTLRGLGGLGRVAVFGGAIRDLAIRGNSEFPSDIDVVLEAATAEALAGQMDAMGATRNRFGGYRFCTSRWKFDVWRLEDTWAIRNGYVEGHSIEALLHTTFFDWDAVAYDFTQHRLLVSTGYFDRLLEGVVGINLMPNPNPLGNARRALHIYASGLAALDFSLAKFVIETIRPQQEEAPYLNDLVRDVEMAAGRPVRRRVEQLSFT